jgi:hypothetical protein
MSQGLRAQLIGAWKLVSYQEIPVDGSEPFEPLGGEPHGIIMYTPDGYMSAQLSTPDRPKFASGDWFAGTPEEYQLEASRTSPTRGPSMSTKSSRRSPIRCSSRCSRTGPVRPSRVR